MLCSEHFKSITTLVSDQLHDIDLVKSNKALDTSRAPLAMWPVET